jgi:hypothetical protein
MKIIVIIKASPYIYISHLKTKVYGWKFRHQQAKDVAVTFQPRILKYCKITA